MKALLFSIVGLIKEFPIIELLRTISWPVVVLLAIFFFRKTFAYLFFSMEEFNFFGAKGKLKNVRDMINEKAQDLLSKKEREKESKEKEQKFLAEIERSNRSEKDWENLAKRILSSYSKANNDLSMLTAQAEERQKQVSALLEQVAALQALISDK